MPYKACVAVALLCMLASQTYATRVLPTCESDGSGGICSQVLTVFCLISSCSTCCQHTSTCPPSPSFVLKSQCSLPSPSPPKPTTNTPMVVTHGPCAAVLCIVGKTCVNVGGFAICEQTCSNPVSCIVHPCSVATCPARPGAACRANFCGGCHAHFYLNGKNVTDVCSVTSKPPTTAPVATTPLSCGPVCGIFCQYGNVLDSRGCPLCMCKPRPSTAMTTKELPATTRIPSTTPVTTRIPSTTPVTTGPASVTCGPLCRKFCMYGYVLDANGCATCQCKPPPSPPPTTTSRVTPSRVTHPMLTSGTKPPRTGSPMPPRTGSPTSRVTSPRQSGVTSPRQSGVTSPRQSTGTSDPCVNVRCAGGPCVAVGGYPVCTQACSPHFSSCSINPCTLASCPGHASASCLANYCGGCNAQFYDQGMNVTATCHPTPKPTAVPVTTCQPCANRCANGLSADVDTNGCSMCVCNPSTEVKMTRVTLEINLGKSLFDSLQQTGDTPSDLKQLSWQIRKQLQSHFNLSESRLQNFTASSKHIDGVYSATVSFDVHGVESQPSPALLVQNIRESLVSKSLQLQYSANGQVYPMAVSRTSTDAEPLDSPTASNTVAISVGVAVPAGLILIAVVGIVVYRARNGRARPAGKDDTALMKYGVRSSNTSPINGDDDDDVVAGGDNPTYVVA